MDKPRLTGMLRIIEAADMKSTSISETYGNVKPILEKIAESLRIAKIDIFFHVRPDEYDMQGLEKHFETVFCPDCEPDEENAVAKVFEDVGNSAAEMKITPCKGVVWNADYRDYLSTFMKLLYILLSRANNIRRAEKAPYIDSLTGLSNNLGIEHYWSRIVNDRPMSGFAAVYINLRGFRLLNVRFGSVLADDIMKRYSHTLYKLLIMGDELIARLGGDNFFIIINKDKLESFIDNAKFVQMEVDTGERVRPVRLHAWIGVYPANDGDSLSTLVTRSSFAADQSKKRRVQVSYFEQSEMDDSVHEEMTSRIMPRALERGEFMPFYQPKVNLETGELYGCEALVRWFHRDRMISPGEFIPIAEKSGFITKIDLFMLDRVCADLREWIDNGIEPVCVSINYSQKDFYSETLISDTLAAIEKYGIDSKYIEIEITESSYIENSRALETFVAAMHEHGIKVSLDDFGTGYSSLNMFKYLDLDTIKLDKSLFDDFENHDSKSRLILHSISEMVNELHSVSIAEGIETEE
ncbi:MAG: EAL domain-containing protein, partial [Methanomicrobium sp.]|nr:EAL domain-containing protein [Methanomicrobium sp.]